MKDDKKDGAGGVRGDSAEIDLDEMKSFVGALMEEESQYGIKVTPITREKKPIVLKEEDEARYLDYVNALSKENKEMLELEAASKERVRASREEHKMLDVRVAKPIQEDTFDEEPVERVSERKRPDVRVAKSIARDMFDEDDEPKERLRVSREERKKPDVRVAKAIDRHDYTPDLEKPVSAAPQNMKLAFVAVILVFVSAALLMAIKMNALSSDNKELTLKASGYDDLKSEMQALNMENERLKSEVETLLYEKDVEDYSPAENTDTDNGSSSYIASDDDPVDEQPIITAPPSDSTPNEGTAVTEPQKPTEHTVAKGDNLTKIAKKYYGNDNLQARIEEIVKINNLKSPNDIRVGEKLLLP